MIDELYSFLKQDRETASSMEDGLEEMARLLTYKKLGKS
jgi:hypothetical protein